MNRILLSSVGALLLAAVAAAQKPAPREGVSVQMPITANALIAPDADREDAMVIAVTSAGDVFVGTADVTPGQLLQKLKAETEGHSGKRIYVKGDARAPYSYLITVFATLREAGVHAPVLLTAQPAPPGATYVAPWGLEVLLSPPGPDPARSTTFRVGRGQPSDGEVRQRVRRDSDVLLEPAEAALFGDVVHIADVCRAAGSRAFLSTGGGSGFAMSIEHGGMLATTAVTRSQP